MTLPTTTCYKQARTKIPCQELDENTKRFMMQTLMWIGIYFGISLVVSFFLPFPYSLMVIIAVVIGLGFYRRKRYFRGMGGSGQSGSYFGSMFGGQERNNVNYYCMNCGTKHNEAACPNCGSKLKKAGF